MRRLSFQSLAKGLLSQKKKKVISARWCSHTSGVQFENAREGRICVPRCLKLQSWCGCCLEARNSENSEGSRVSACPPSLCVARCVGFPWAHTGREGVLVLFIWIDPKRASSWGKKTPTLRGGSPLQARKAHPLPHCRSGLSWWLIGTGRERKLPFQFHVNLKF